MRSTHWFTCSLLFVGVALASAGYDPLARDMTKAEIYDVTVKDEKRTREIPLRIYLPTDTKPAAVVLFSHGLGGARTGSAFLGQHWAARGYVAVFLQHPGSDESVWKDTPPAQRMAAMKKAANAENFMLRVRDVPAVLDQLEVWNKAEGHRLLGRLNLQQVGMSGHSFGAVTTQAVSGQTFPIGPSVTDARIRAAVIMSPSGARKGSDGKATFGNVKLPWLLMTGTNDTSPIGDIDVKSRLSVYPALPTGGKYELVLDKAEHSVFTERALPGEKEQRNPKHHPAILALSTAFWDAYLRNDETAKQWLDSADVRKLLDPADTWQKK